MNNSGEGIYEDELLTSVNDFTWGKHELIPVEAIAHPVEYAK